MKADTAEVFEEVGETATKLARRTLVRGFEYLGELLILLGRTVRAIWQEGIHPGDLVRQLTTVGTESVPIVLLTVGFSGAVLALYTVGSLTNLGIGNLLGGIVALSIVRETGPLITAVTLIARVGSGITAEIGAMKTTEQVDALRAMGISPVAYLVVPRLLACLVMPILQYGLAQVALYLSFENGVSAVWPTAGMYLAAVLDLHSRKIVGWAMSPAMPAALV